MVCVYRNVKPSMSACLVFSYQLPQKGARTWVHDHEWKAVKMRLRATLCAALPVSRWRRSRSRREQATSGGRLVLLSCRVGQLPYLRGARGFRGYGIMQDGNLRVFMWPTMEIILNEAQAHTSVKDLTFSPNGKFLVSLGRILCRVWDLTTLKAVASLPRENDEAFAFCRFSLFNSKDQLLSVAAITGRGASIITWNTNSWKRIRSKQVVRDSISAFNVSVDSKLLAIGTIQGDILIIDSSTLRVQTVVRKAHLGLVTALTFSHDSRALLSVSMDSSVRMTVIKDKKKNGGMNLWVIIFIVVLAVTVYLMRNKGIIP